MRRTITAHRPWALGVEQGEPLALMGHVDQSTWRMRAACLGTPDADGFYPPPTSRRVPDVVQRLCPSCPVKRECLVTAITTPAGNHGWWAGLSPAVIRELRVQVRVSRYAG